MDSSSPEKIERLYDYHKHNLVYIGDYIKFADTKAGVAIGANLVALGFFGNEIKNNNYLKTSLAEVYLIIGVLLLSLAAYYLLKVLWPRYTLDKEYYMSWGGVAAFEKDSEYIKLVHGKIELEFLKDMAKQNHALANISAEKYGNLRNGLTFFITGVSLSSLSWFFS